MSTILIEIGKFIIFRPEAPKKYWIKFLRTVIWTLRIGLHLYVISLHTIWFISFLFK